MSHSRIRTVALRTAYGLISAALAVVVTLGFGGVAEAAPASVPAAATAASNTVKAPSVASLRWVTVGYTTTWQCVAYGQYYVASGQARHYQCLPISPFTAILRVLVY